ncbi:MAG: S-layer homology domain-containing protein [Candidatus Gastranaerophilales bacterium]
MTIKKLTVAAAVAVGIATCSLNQAMAACPCNQAKTVAPIETPKCNSCQKKVDDCGCKKVEQDCGEEVSCEKPAVPTCALCPASDKADKSDMKQVYGYPNALYGTNNYVGETANSIFSTEKRMLPSSQLLQSNVAGVTVASDAGTLTGAATSLPSLGGDITSYNGMIIDRTPLEPKASTGCPIDFQSANSIDAVKKTLVPFEIPYDKINMLGAAANIGGHAFPDVPENLWASCDINKLAINDIVVGYPDGYFKPYKNITRAEFATILVKGFNMDNCAMSRDNLFKDVPTCNWANPAIAKVVDEDLMAGYPNGLFNPNSPVTRAEALTTIAKGITTDMSECRADEILSKYTDGGSVPAWARIPVATSLENGALKDMPNPNMIMPNKQASRAEVASMMQTVRVALGYDTNPKTANEVCPVDMDKQAFVEDEQIITIPTLKLSMIDQITAKSSHVGQHFRAKTLEDVSINGVSYPCGSIVLGQVVEVIRPSGCDKGALKLSFSAIKNGECEANLPQQILQAEVNKEKNVNPVARLVEMPFTWVGSMVGIVGRTVGGAITNLGNAAENVSNDAGYMFGNAFQGEFGAAGRSLGDGLWETVKAPIDLTRTALSGTMGLFQTTGDEVTYLVDPDGSRISAVNPKEHITIAFGCGH